MDFVQCAVHAGNQKTQEQTRCYTNTKPGTFAISVTQGHLENKTEDKLICKIKNVIHVKAVYL